MRKRKKRTSTWRGLGNLLSFEIDDRAHDVAIVKNTNMRNLVCKFGHGTAQRGRVGMGEVSESVRQLSTQGENLIPEFLIPELGYLAIG
jgi:hypothetical protein